MNNLRTWMWLLGISALVVGLAACSSQPAPAPTATPKPPAAVQPSKPAAVAPSKPAPPPTVAPVTAPAKPTAAPAKPAPAPTARPAAAAAPTPTGPALVPQFADLQRVVSVQSAQAYIDGAGFHDMAEEIEKTKEIKSSYVGKVRNVMATANAVPWPSELAKEQQKLMADLKALDTALVGNKPPEAAKAAKEAHESEHDLSKATFGWLGGQSKLNQVSLFKTPGDPNHMLGCTAVQSAQAYIDGAGFHAMAEEIEKTKEIKSSYVGKVRNVMAVANAIPWPSELAKEQQKLKADLKPLEAALVGNKPQDAMKAAKEAHESEHDLSKASFGWLGSHPHNFAPLMGMMGTNKMMMGAMMAGVQSAQAYIDGAGLHAMAEEIEKTKEIKSSYVGKVRNVMAVARAVPWPSELTKEQQKLMADLKALEAALVGNKAPDAAKAAKEVHESEHDLSKATFGWLGKQKI